MDIEVNPWHLQFGIGVSIKSILLTSNIDFLTLPAEAVTGENVILPIDAEVVAPHKVFSVGTNPSVPTMRLLLATDLPDIPMTQVIGLEAALNSLVRSLESANALLTVTHNAQGDHIITANTGTTGSTLAIGNDSRFPANVVGLRKGAGGGALDTAAVSKVDYWNTTVFVPSGGTVIAPAPDRRGLVPDPGVSSGTTKFLCEDGLWKTAGVGSVTSVGFQAPSLTFSVTGSPVTGSGNIVLAWLNVDARKFLAGPPGAAVGIPPQFRYIDYDDVASIVGTTASKIAAGNDTRFPANVTGIRKSTGLGSTDVAAVKYTDYWDNTVFGGKGPSAQIGLVPSPGPGAAPFVRFLRDDGTWQPVTVGLGELTNSMMAAMPAKTVKANATTGSATPTDVTAKDARSSLLLNLESITTFGNTDYTGLATDRYITTTVPFTAFRTVYLPLANTFNPGQPITIADDGNAISAAFILKIGRQGSDTIQGGVATLTMDTPKGSYTFVSDGVSKWSVIRRSPSVVRRFFTSNGTYDTPTGVKALFVEGVAAGGGGAGAQAAAGQCSAGGGGGAGGVNSTMIHTPAASYAMTVGTAGLGGAAGASGGVGGDTFFGGSLIAQGGAGGAAMPTGTAPAFSLPGAGGVSSGGDVNLSGSYGGHGQRVSGTLGLSGWGASAQDYSMSISGRTVTEGTGNSPGAGYGAGGAGALSLSGTGFAGGAGRQGIIFVTEHY